jgi:hypothetical protein
MLILALSYSIEKSGAGNQNLLSNIVKIIELRYDNVVR